jgi:hypothetical protein
MKILMRLEQMSERQFNNCAEFHSNTADILERQHRRVTSLKFRELALMYSKELERRREIARCDAEISVSA